MPKRGLMPNETACESSQMPAVAPPGETASDLFFRFSRDSKNPQPFWRSPDVQRLGLCSTEKLMFHILCSTLMFQGGLCSTGLCSRLGLMFHRPGLCSTERPGESSQMRAGGATEAIWDDSARRFGDSACRYPH